VVVYCRSGLGDCVGCCAVSTQRQLGMSPLRKVIGFREAPWEHSRRDGIKRQIELRLECGHTLKRLLSRKPVQRARCHQCGANTP
jgi:hypothetical protein